MDPVGDAPDELLALCDQEYDVDEAAEESGSDSEESSSSSSSSSSNTSKKSAESSDFVQSPVCNSRVTPIRDGCVAICLRVSGF